MVSLMTFPERAVYAPLLAVSILFLAPVMGAPAEETAPVGQISFEVRGLRSDDGQLHVALFSKPDGFPGKRQNALRKEVVSIADGLAVGSFEGVEYGEYAISAFHDEDDNGELGTNWFGMPKEGVGTSRDPKSRFGPPRWGDAVFELGAPSMTLQITMRYLGF